MKLKEKLFDAIFDGVYELKPEKAVYECEVISDEFAIDFAEWIDKNYMQHPYIHNFYAKSEDYFNKGKTYHIKQLLEIYKKQE